MSNKNPFFSYIAFTYGNRYYFITRETNVLAFLLCLLAHQAIQLLQAGWYLSSEQAGGQPMKNGFHRRCYKSIRHTVTWIHHDIRSYRKWQVTHG